MTVLGIGTGSRTPEAACESVGEQDLVAGVVVINTTHSYK